MAPSEDTWDKLLRSCRQQFVVDEEPAVTRIEGDAHLQPLRDFVHLASQAVAIGGCEASWETKKKILLGYLRTPIAETGVDLKRWLGQEISPEADVKEYTKVLEERAAEIRKVLAAVDALVPRGQ